MTSGVDVDVATKTKVHVDLGVEQVLEGAYSLGRGVRVGLVCNQASVDHQYRHVADVFHEHDRFNVTALFGPQHGIRGDVQDNMIETDHAIDRKTGLPIYSLYSETRIPTDKMLDDVDVIIFDMQDVGCRIYTFIYTMANCMIAAAKQRKKVLVCDRPNPISGSHVSGNVLEPAFSSFVGQYPIPTRHGMTVGELARLFNHHFKIGCDVEVIEMKGWERDLWMDQVDTPWVLPSPNMPTLDSATVFPATVHFEGTQMSEGRGTTRPFELVGAPYVGPDEYADALNSLGLLGIYFRSCVFQPTFQKHARNSCGGVQLHVLNRASFEPVKTGIAMIKTAYDLYPNEFLWKEPPYEYVFDKNPFDVICGTDKIRKAIEEQTPLNDIVESWEKDLSLFEDIRQDYLIY